MLGALKTVFCLMCLFAGETAEVPDQTSPPPILQKPRSMSANVGQRITLECYYDSEKISFFYWYKQPLGEQPKLMANFYHYDNQIALYGEFKNDPRFTDSSENGISRLMIADSQMSDSGTYYCARISSSTVEFAEGTTVLVQDSGASFPVRVEQWASGSVQPGSSVTLQCRFETGSCAGEARVYWLRESREAEAGVLYAAGGSQQQQCVSNASAQTHACLNTLPMSLDPSHTGIYYCAVASCGRLLFGNGTKLDFGHEGHSPALVIFLGVALAFTSVLSLSLAVFLCVVHRRSKSPASVTTNQEDGGNHDVQYGAINIKKDRGPRRRGEEAEPECTYARVRQ